MVEVITKKKGVMGPSRVMATLGSLDRSSESKIGDVPSHGPLNGLSGQWRAGLILPGLKVSLKNKDLVNHNLGGNQ